jgi:hypothetical protein
MAEKKGAAAGTSTKSADLPTELEESVKGGLALLRTKLRCSTQTAASHSVLVVEGWGDGPEIVAAIAAYLVGLLASAVNRALVVRAQITDTDSDRLELLRNVEALTGSQGAPLGVDQKQDQRNPWIAEGIWHLCLLLSAARNELHPHGPIIALDLPHIAAKDHGFDVVGIYRNASTYGVSFVESKAYEKDPNGAVNDAVAFYREIESGKHDARARQAVASMRESLPAAEQSAISSSLWKDERTYLPNPHYDASIAMDWTNTRPSFARLGVPKDRIVLMPHAIQKFPAFFEDVADAMLTLATKLRHV